MEVGAQHHALQSRVPDRVLSTMESSIMYMFSNSTGDRSYLHKTAAKQLSSIASTNAEHPLLFVP
jgi:hypothetical protein